MVTIKDLIEKPYFWEIFGIFFLLTLNVGILLQAQVVSGEVCAIEFKQLRYAGAALDEPRIIRLNASQICSYLNNDICPLKWDRVQGYLWTEPDLS